MRRPHPHRWLRVALGALLLTGLALCSAADPDPQPHPRLDELQTSLEAEEFDAVIAAAGAILDESPESAGARAKLGLALLGKARSETHTPSDRLEEATDAGAFFNPANYETDVNWDDTLRSQAKKEFTKALAADAKNLDALVGMAMIHSETGDLEAEKQFVTRAAKAHAGDEEAGRRLLRFGEKYFTSGKYDEALAIFEVLSGPFGDDPTVALDYGGALYATGSYDRGIEMVEKAAKRDPENDRIHRTLGQMYLFRLRWQDAARAFGDAEKSMPDDPMVTLHRGAALMPVNPDDARLVFQGIVAAVPEGKTPAMMIASNLILAMDAARITPGDLIYLSDELSRNRMPQISAAIGGFALARHPRSVVGRLILSSVYGSMQYHDLSLQAMAEAERLFQEDPAASAPFTEADVAGSYARAYFHMGEHQKAVDKLLASESPERFHMALAMAYEAMEDYARAFEHFNKVIAQGKPESNVQQARYHLKKEPYAAFHQEP